MGAEWNQEKGEPSLRGERLRWSLRTRIVAALAFTVILLSGTIAAIGLTSLRVSLVDQLDGSLRSLSSRVSLSWGLLKPGSLNEQAGDLLQHVDSPGVVSGAVVVYSDAQGSAGAVIDENYTAVRLSNEQLLRVLEGWNGSSVRDIVPGGGLGSYRFLIEQHDYSTVIVGLPLATVEETISSLGFTMGFVATAGSLLFGFLAAWYIRSELRPLERVADAAERVATTSLDRGQVRLQRAEDPGQNAASEVTRLVSGFNSMIDRVTQAFQARHFSEEKMRRFVADASHELRTPLASIRGYSELTRRMGLDLPDDAKYALGRIESESVRMTRLVEDLLLLARIDEGQALSKQSVDLSVMLSDTVNDAAVAGADHEWSFEASREPLTVLGDPARLQQVFVNLLANARVHTPSGTKVSVSAEEREGWVIVCVNDNGPGIPRDELPQLFERFVRADASRARTTGSTGLGLAIVQAIVGAHGGELQVTSAPGNTTFSVRIPVTSVSDSPNT